MLTPQYNPTQFERLQKVPVTPEHSKRTMFTLIPALSGLLALVIGLLFASQGVRLADGSRVLPLDDAYIHLQYGWQAANGHFLEYNSGDIPTSGATSLLYQLIVALGFVVGISREAMPDVVVGFGTLCFVITTVLVVDWVNRLAGENTSDAKTPATWVSSLLAGLLFAASGWMAWGYHTGMETGLFVLLVTGTLWAATARYMGWVAILGSLAVMTRPESLLLVGAVFLLEVLRPWLAGGPYTLAALSQGLKSAPVAIALAALPLLAWFISPLVNALVTGSASASGFLAKSWFTMVPFDPVLTLERIATYSWEMAALIIGGFVPKGGYGYAHSFPLAQVVALIGAFWLWRRGGATQKSMVLAATGWIALEILAISTLQTQAWHRYRYLMPVYPALIGLASVGLVESGRWLLQRKRWLGLTVAGVSALIVASVTILSLKALWERYELDSASTQSQQFVMAAWLQENTDADALIAVNDVGVMRFIGERRTVDVVGLTTAGMTSTLREGPGASYEALYVFQPDYIATYLTGPPYWGVDTSGELFGEVLLDIDLPVHGVGSGGRQIISRPDWSLGDGAAQPTAPSLLGSIDSSTLIAAINVAHLSSEENYSYHYSYASQNFRGFATLPLVQALREDPSQRFADGVRVLSGGELFTVTTQPHQPLLLVGRFHQEVNVALDISINGVPAGQWLLPAIPGEWLESSFSIPAELVTTEQAEISIRINEPGPGKVYSPGYYWVFQGGSRTTPEASQALNVNFGDSIRLYGADLPSGELRPGEALTLTLYWETTRPPHEGALNVFVHLVRADNPDSLEGLVAQVDQAPRRGAHPFWTWAIGERGLETMTLELPPDLPPDEYLLLVGLYDLASGQRLGVPTAQDFGDDRLLLSSYSVR